MFYVCFFCDLETKSGKRAYFSLPYFENVNENQSVNAKYCYYIIHIINNRSSDVWNVLVCTRKTSKQKVKLEKYDIYFNL